MSEFVNPPQGYAVAASDDPNADILNTTLSHLQRMRYFRRQYDQRRALFYRQYLAQRDQRYFPDNLTPRSNTFVPYPLSNVETIVSRVLDAYFSTEDWMECKGRSAMDEDAAEKMQAVLMKKLHQSKFIQHFETLIRNVVIYGHAGIKVDWDWDYELVNYPAPIYAQDGQGNFIVDPQTGGPILQRVVPQQKLVPRARPKFIPIDVYDLLVDPDGGIVAHLTERTLGQMKREQQMSIQAMQMDPTRKPLYDPQGLQLLESRVSASGRQDPDAVVIRLAELWNEYDKTQTVMTFGEDSEAISWKDLRASYRSAGYSPYKRLVYAGQPILLYHGPIPFSHQRAPILYTSFIKVPNEVFGLGAIEIISDMTESLNRFVNMIADNWNLGVNRRYAFDVNIDIDHEGLNSFNTPGGKVGVNGDPTKAIVPLPFFTPQAGDYQVLDLYKGMVEMTSGVSDFYAKAIGGPNNNKTATGINQIINESNFRFRMFIRNLELDVLQPLLEMCASMVQQYLTDQEEVLVTGEPPMIHKWITVSPEELVGNFDFDLVAANYATNRFIKQRNLLALMNLASQSPYLNQYEALKELFKAFELRNINRLLYTPQQVQIMQAQQQEQQVKMMMLESALQTEGKARIQQSKPQTSTGKDGRKRTTQFEGKIPGAGLTGAIRELAQGMGANSLGMEGIEGASGG